MRMAVLPRWSSSSRIQVVQKRAILAAIVTCSSFLWITSAQDVQEAPSTALRSPHPNWSSSSLSASAVPRESSVKVQKTPRIVVDWKANKAPPSSGGPSPVGEGRALGGLPVAAGGLLAAAASAGFGLYHGLNSGARSLLQPGTIGTYVQDRIGQFLDFVSPSGGDTLQEFPHYEPNAERPQRRSFGSEHRRLPAAANLYPAAGNAPILTASRKALGPKKKVMKRGIPLRPFNVHGRGGGLNKFYKPYGKLQRRQQFPGYGAAYQNYLSKPFGGYQDKNPYGFNPVGLFGAGFPGLSQDSSSVESFFMTSGNKKSTLGLPDKKYSSYYLTPSGLKAAPVPAGSDSDSGENKQYIPKAPTKKYSKGTIVRESSEEHSVKTYGKYSNTKGALGSKSNRKGDEDSNSHEHLKIGHKYLKHLKHIGHLTGDDSSNDGNNSDDKPCVNGNCNDNSDSDERGVSRRNPAAAGSSAAPVVFHGPNLGFNFEGNKGGGSSGDPYGYGNNKAKHVGPSPMLHFYFFPEDSGEDVKQVIRDQAKLLKTRPSQSDENGNSSDDQQDSNEDSNDDGNGSTGTGDSSEPQFGGYYIVPSPKKSTTNKGKGYTIRSNSKSHGDHDSSEEKAKRLPSAKYKIYGVKGRNTNKGGDDSSSEERERGRKQSLSSKSSKYGIKGKSNKGNDDSNSHEVLQQPPPVYYLVETKNGKSVGSDSDSKEQPKVYQILPSPSTATPKPPQDDSNSNEGNEPKSYYKTKVTHTVIQQLPVSAGNKYYHHGHQDSDSQDLARRPTAYSKSASASKNKKPKSTTDSSSEENTKAKSGKSSKSPKQPVFVKLDPKNGYKIIPISDSDEGSTEKGHDSSQSQERAGFRLQTPANEYGSGPVPAHSIQAHNVYYATHRPQQPILANYPTVPPPWPTTPSPLQQRPSSDSSSEENNNWVQQSVHISIPKPYHNNLQQYGPPGRAPASYPTKGSRDQTSNNKSIGLYRLKVEQQHSGYRPVNQPAVQHYGTTTAPASASYKLNPHQQPKLKHVYSDSTERSRPSYSVTTPKLPVYKPAPTARPYTQQSVKHHITYRPATILHQKSRPSQESSAHGDNKVWLKSSTTPHLQAPPRGTQSYPDGQLENVHQIIHASEESEQGQQKEASILGSNQGVDKTLLNAHKDFGPAAAQPSNNKGYSYGKEAGNPAVFSTVDSRDKKTRTAPAYYNHGPTHTPALTSVPIWGEFPVPSGTTTQQYQQTEKSRLHKFTSQEAKDSRSSEEITASIQDFTKQDVPGKAAHYQTSKQSGFAYTTIVDHSQRRNAETTASSEVSAVDKKDTANSAS